MTMVNLNVAFALHQNKFVQEFESVLESLFENWI